MSFTEEPFKFALIIHDMPSHNEHSFTNSAMLPDGKTTGNW